MSGSGISFSGLGSGLDSSRIIDQLVALERLPINALALKKKGLQDKISNLGTLRGHVRDLQTKARELGSKREFLEFKVTPSAEGVASFSPSGLAVAGNHTLTVLRLASVDRWAFSGVAAQDTDLATAAGQQLSFDIDGTNYSITVQQDQSSLAEIAQEINDLAGEDVSASVVNVGTESSPSYQLVLSADESGEDARISNLSSTIAGLAISWSAPDANGAATSAANITVGNNARAVIDGLTVERETNEFGGVVTGVGITVNAADPAKTITFGVEADKTAIKKKLQDFVDAYNEVIEFVNKQNTYDEETGPGGNLIGDPLLDTVRSRINSALFDVDEAAVAADTEGFSALSLVGIRRDRQGLLSIDNTDLDEKMNADLDAFADLFIDLDGFDNGGAAQNSPGYYTDTSADSGVAASLDRAIDRLLRSVSGTDDVVVKGIFDARTETYNSDIRRFDRQIDAKEQYIERYRAGLVTRFARLEQLIGGLNAQGASLASMLGS